VRLCDEVWGCYGPGVSRSGFRALNTKREPVSGSLFVSCLERIARFELAPKVWKTLMLTVEHHTRVCFVLFLYRLFGQLCDHDGIRTRSHHIDSVMFYR
jgi:hypothetical protein